MRMCAAIVAGMMLTALGCASREFSFVTDAGTRIDSVELTRQLAFRHAVNEGDAMWGFQIVHVGHDRYASLNRLALQWPGETGVILAGSSRLISASGNTDRARYIENALFPVDDELVRRLAEAPDPIALEFTGSDGDAPPITLAPAQADALRRFIHRRAGS